MSLSPQWLDELRARITLSAVIGRTTRLTKAGHEFKACCPFHNEKSPSFTVNDQKGFYHCFGCGAHGDAIRWMTDQRGLSFMDAVKELAAEAGLEVPAPDPRAARIAEKQSGLHDVMQAAQDWYRAQLETPAGAKAREYLASRRFDAHTMERFGFGYAPAGRQALKTALGKFDEAMLVEAGMRIAVDDKEPYDRFRDRLTMPIQDARGRVIGFAARILDSEKKDAPKYLNSPDTPLFDKGRTLFNLHRAGPASRQSGRIVVVEGQMDVVALAAAGIDEAVAPMGTALTERQLEMLWRLVEAPILCFDGDSAGQRAAMRAITRALPLLRPAHTLRICRLPTGLDPDDLIKQQGVAALEQVLVGAKSLIETLWENERDALPLATPEDKAGLKARLLAHVETIADPDIKALYRRELLERFSDFAFARREMEPPRSGGFRRQPGFQRQNTIPAPAPETARRLQHATGAGRRDTLGAAVLDGLILHPSALLRHLEVLSRARLGDGVQARLLDALLDLADQGGQLDSARVITTLAAQGLAPLGDQGYSGIRYPFTRPDVPPEIALPALESAIIMLVEGPELDAAIETATERFDFDEQSRLRNRKRELEERLKAQLRS
ncbi:DNA primase [Novosphingobium sp. TH158]|uniref:DNA primase n=1 Tax=Novosphingobium sp. TH158 TaxID=2067455 RepID=UPI000C7CB1C4|nr:DNA primase [Novosphingobium sp. TH158]PLK25978.1 DNA primase [Novosphingobium sp. TH158]